MFYWPICSAQKIDGLVIRGRLGGNACICKFVGDSTSVITCCLQFYDNLRSHLSYLSRTRESDLARDSFQKQNNGYTNLHMVDNHDIVLNAIKTKPQIFIEIQKIFSCLTAENKRNYWHHSEKEVSV
jgi:hypothetical protein